MQLLQVGTEIRQSDILNTARLLERVIAQSWSRCNIKPHNDAGVTSWSNFRVRGEVLGSAVIRRDGYGFAIGDEIEGSQPSTR